MHFSEDSHITRFMPHIAATTRDETPYVWAGDASALPASRG